MALSIDEKKQYKSDYPDMPHSPLKAIRVNCLDCMGGGAKASNLVRLCDQDGRCSMWAFRFGKGLGIRVLTEEQRKELSERGKSVGSKKWR